LFDRRHDLRLLLSMRSRAKLRTSLALEVATGTPFTPVTGVVWVGIPTPYGGVGRGGSAPGTVVYETGLENSARGGATAHADASVSYDTRGPWRSKLSVTLSVVNLLVGPVAPVGPGSPSEANLFGTPVQYDRAFTLPPIPTIIVEVHW